MDMDTQKFIDLIKCEIDGDLALGRKFYCILCQVCQDLYESLRIAFKLGWKSLLDHFTWIMVVLEGAL